MPAEVLFEGVRGGNESLAVQRALGEWLTPGDELFFEALDRANAIRNSILQAEVIAYEIDADAGDDNVIEIFARLNQQGVRLRPGDLAAARLTGQMSQLPHAGPARCWPCGELRGFSMPEGQEEGEPQRRLRGHRSADPRGAVPGRRRACATGTPRSASARPTTRRSRPAGTATVDGLQEGGGAVPQRRASPRATGCPTATCCCRRPSPRRAGIALDEKLDGLGHRGQPVAALRRRGGHQAAEGRRPGREGGRRRPDRARQAAGQADRERGPRRGGSAAQHRQRGRA